MTQALLIGGIAAAGLLAFSMRGRGGVEASQADLLAAQQAAADDAVRRQAAAQAEADRMRARAAELDLKEAERDAKRERDQRERAERDHQRRMDEIRRENERQDRRDREWEEKETWRMEQERQRQTETALAAEAEMERILRRAASEEEQELEADRARAAMQRALAYTPMSPIEQRYQLITEEEGGSFISQTPRERTVQERVARPEYDEEGGGFQTYTQLADPHAAQRAAQAIRVKQLQAQVDAQIQRSKWEPRMSGSSNTTPAYDAGPGRSFRPITGTSSTVELQHDWDWDD